MGKERIRSPAGDRAIWTEQLIRCGGARGGGEDEIVNLSDVHSENRYLLSVCPDWVSALRELTLVGMDGNKHRPERSNFSQ